MGNVLFTDLTLGTKGNARHVTDINRWLLNIQKTVILKGTLVFDIFFQFFLAPISKLGCIE